jgi:hypothetical protein
MAAAAIAIGVLTNTGMKLGLALFFGHRDSAPLRAAR